MIIYLLMLACASSEKDTGTGEPTAAQPISTDTAPTQDTEQDDPCGWNSVDDATDPLSLSGDAACGAEIYLDKCAICHMENGEGSNAGKQLAGFIDQYSDAHLVEVIKNGWGPMPPVNLNPQQIADVIVHLRENF